MAPFDEVSSTLPYFEKVYLPCGWHHPVCRAGNRAVGTLQLKKQNWLRAPDPRQPVTETARRLYLDWADHSNRRLVPLLVELAAEEEAEIARIASAFSDWWTDERVFALRQWFEAFLEDSGGGPPKADSRETWNFDDRQTPDKPRHYARSPQPLACERGCP